MSDANANAGPRPAQDSSDSHSGEQVFPKTNSEFIRAILPRELAPDERLWVTSFAGDPNKVAPQYWKGAAYTVDMLDSLTETNNNYVSIALFGADAKGRKQQFSRGMWATVLDDVQSIDTLPLMPTAVIQTSPTKVQVWYAMAELMPPEDAERFQKHLGRSGYLGADKSGHNSVRYARLPFGANGKTDPPAPCSVLVLR